MSSLFTTAFFTSHTTCFTCSTQVLQFRCVDEVQFCDAFLFFVGRGKLVFPWALRFACWSCRRPRLFVSCWVTCWVTELYIRLRVRKSVWVLGLNKFCLVIAIYVNSVLTLLKWHWLCGMVMGVVTRPLIVAASCWFFGMGTGWVQSLKHHNVAKPRWFHL